MCSTTPVRIVVAYMQKYAGIGTTLYPYILSQESVNNQLLMRIKIFGPFARSILPKQLAEMAQILTFVQDVISMLIAY